MNLYLLNKKLIINYAISIVNVFLNDIYDEISFGKLYIGIMVQYRILSFDGVLNYFSLNTIYHNHYNKND